MRRYICTLFLSAFLIAPIAVMAQDRNSQSQRYYDRTHKDWHEWNDNENRAYHQYLTERRKPEHDFARAKSRERNEYFQWRHSHQDSDRH